MSEFGASELPVALIAGIMQLTNAFVIVDHFTTVIANIIVIIMSRVVYVSCYRRVGKIPDVACRSSSTRIQSYVNHNYSWSRGRH